MDQTYAILEQSRSDSAESSVEENPLFPIQDLVFPHTELHDQAKTGIKDKLAKQGSRLSARLKGIPDSGSLFRSQDSSQPPPRKTKKKGASSKAKTAAKTSEVLPTGINTPGFPPVERPLSVRRPSVTKPKEPKVKYRAPEPPFEVVDYYSDDNLSPSNKYLDLGPRLRRRERQSHPFQFKFSDPYTFGGVARETPPPPFELAMAEGFSPGNNSPPPIPVENPSTNPFFDSQGRFVPAVPQPQGLQNNPENPTAPPHDGAASFEAF